MIQTANSAHSSICGLFYYTQLLATAQITNLEVVANRPVEFLNINFVLFPVANGAMMLRAVEKCTRVFSPT
jgi:hypothetical protein